MNDRLYELDLIYSPDDAMECGKGWYLQQAYGEWKTSQLFEAKEEAIKAKNENKLIFN